ncbi:MAG: YraN family protein [Phycisphaerales bacterium]
MARRSGLRRLADAVRHTAGAAWRFIGLRGARAGDAEYLRVGRLGEEAAAQHLRGAGMVVVARNALVKFGEADIVAREGGVFVVVEVKTRLRDGGGPRQSNTVAPEASVTRAKMAKLKRIGSWLAGQNAWPAWRIDVVAVEVAREGEGLRVRSVRHLRDVR